MNQDQQLSAPSVESALAEVTDRFLDAMRRGEQPSIEEYARQHPTLASVLRMILPALAGVHAATDSVDHEYSSARSDEKRNETIGDFRILREAGRGGMGVVYEAEQLSLSRRVALKILPFAAVLDPRHLQRFKNEALAAAHLDHPNIVEVYGIGCERSIHFYAMRFIEGVTLAEVVEAKRKSQSGNVEAPNLNVESNPNDEARTEVFSHSSDTSLSTPHASLAAETSPVLQAALSTVNSITPKERFRRIAEIGIQAAEALDHAHQMGIVHRDIKPSNLMLDERGKLWVTDFGLARNQGDASMTMTGDLVGTLRYMSPEQALAKRITVDHRTDIYSLGVTLYELLTLRATFPSNDREETLRQIAFEEPTSPRKLDKAIPDELETIVLKAMEKNPDDRYATAREVAEDLRRYLEHKPVKARRPSLFKRLRKTARRHTLVVGMALVMIIAVTALGVTIYAQRVSSQQRTVQRVAESLASARTAIEAGNLVLAEKHLAEGNARLGVQRSVLLAAAMEVDKHAAELAVRKTDQERFDKFMALAREDSNEWFRDQAAREALKLYHIASNPNWEQRLDESTLTPERRRQVKESAYGLLVSLANYSCGQEGLALLESARSLQAPTRAFWFIRERIHRKLKEQVEADRDHQQFLAAEVTTPYDCFILARQAGTNGDFAESKRLHQMAIRMQADYYPSLFWLGLNSMSTYSDLDGIGYFTACAALRPDERSARTNRAQIYRAVGRLEDAEADLSSAILSSRAQSDPYRVNRYRIRSDLYRAMGRTEDARKDAETYLGLINETLESKQTPRDEEYLTTLVSRGEINWALGRIAEAEADYSAAIELPPSDEGRLPRLEKRFYFYTSVERTDDARRDAERYIPIVRQQIESQRATLGVKDEDSWPLEALGVALHFQSQYVEAEATLRRRFEAMRAARPETLHTLHCMDWLGLVLLGQREYDNAEQLTRECLALSEKHQFSNRQIANRKMQLGCALLGQAFQSNSDQAASLKKAFEAELLLNTGCEFIERHRSDYFDLDQLVLNELLQHVINLYTNAKQPDEAAKWQAKFNTMQPRPLPAADTAQSTTKP